MEVVIFIISVVECGRCRSTNIVPFLGINISNFIQKFQKYIKMSDPEEAPKSNCSFTFKRRGGFQRPQQAARRRAKAAGSSSSSASSGEEQTVVRVEKKRKVNVMIQKSGGVKKFKVRL
jgi:hypothetical protein